MGRKLSLLIMAGASAMLVGVAPATADHGTGGHSMHMHQHDNHGASIEVPAGPTAPTLTLAVTKDPVEGWNVHLKTTNFRFAPNHASLPHIAGEGHAHLYVNGRKIARVYSGWFHIGSLPEGKVEISATLNANDHRTYSVNGRTVRAETAVDNTHYVH